MKNAMSAMTVANAKTNAINAITAMHKMNAINTPNARQVLNATGMVNAADTMMGALNAMNAALRSKCGEYDWKAALVQSGEQRGLNRLANSTGKNSPICAHGFKEILAAHTSPEHLGNNVTLYAKYNNC